MPNLISMNNDELDGLSESAITAMANHIQIYLGKNQDSNSYVSDNRLFDIVKQYVKKEITNA